MNPVILIILAILLPPLAIYLKVGVNKHLWINIVLCFLFFIPAILHALYIVTR